MKTIRETERERERERDWQTMKLQLNKTIVGIQGEGIG